jgi:hypothetical protein
MRAPTLIAVTGCALAFAASVNAGEPPPLAADIVPPSAAADSAWVLDATPATARLSFTNRKTGQTGFVFSCKPHEEHVAISSRFLGAGGGHVIVEGLWGVSIVLASGSWSQRFLLHAGAHNADPHPQGSADPDNMVLRAIASGGRLQQSEPEAVDLSARSDGERAALRQFFTLCKSDELRRLDPAEAAEDARAAFAKGDDRYLAVQEYSLYVPGLPEDQAAPPADQVRQIEGTSDNSSGDGGSALNANAGAYATIYNREIFAARHAREAAKQKP